ncbi:hypothetical protein JCM10449v2_005889 [Rhodotorula kratochvilovae]
MLAGSPAQAPAPAAAAPPPPPPPPRASKRRLSDAACLPEYGYDDLDDEHDDPHAAHTRSKRTRPHNAPGAAIGSPDRKGLGLAGSSAPPKALSDKEKEQRRVARMIRNRNAAQASRDRKKEHTAFLERRVYDLEQQLRQAGHKVVPTLANPPPSVASSSSRAPPPRSQRALSVLSDDAQGRIADLEDENDGLRSQLHLEQAEAAELRARLDEAEQQLARLAHLQALAPDAPFSPFSGTTTPLPAGYEPTFAFDTPNLSPLPQPEERAFVEERERQRRLASAGPTTATTSRAASAIGAEDAQTQTTDSSRLPVSGTPSPAASYAASSSSSSSSSFPVDIASTPPATESYLELDDVTVSPVWSDWAKGAPLPPLPPLGAGDDGDDAVMKPLREGADESALAFLDLSFLQDGPVTTSC